MAKSIIGKTYCGLEAGGRARILNKTRRERDRLIWVLNMNPRNQAGEDKRSAMLNKIKGTRIQPHADILRKGIGRASSYAKENAYIPGLGEKGINGKEHGIGPDKSGTLR